MAVGRQAFSWGNLSLLSAARWSLGVALHVPPKGQRHLCEYLPVHRLLWTVGFLRQHCAVLTFPIAACKFIIKSYVDW